MKLMGKETTKYKQVVFLKNIHSTSNWTILSCVETAIKGHFRITHEEYSNLPVELLFWENSAEQHWEGSLAFRIRPIAISSALEMKPFSSRSSESNIASNAWQLQRICSQYAANPLSVYSECGVSRE